MLFKILLNKSIENPINIKLLRRFTKLKILLVIKLLSALFRRHNFNFLLEREGAEFFQPIL